jgi:hypothetical protein
MKRNGHFVLNQERRNEMIFKKDRGIPVIDEPTPLQEAGEMIESALLPYRQTIEELDDANVLIDEYIFALTSIIKSLQDEVKLARAKRKNTQEVVDSLLEIIGD